MSLTNSLKKLQRKEELEKEFVESGERDRVEEIVVRRLEETGWTQQVEGMCRDYISKNGCERIELKKMVDELKDNSRKIVPDEVKRELMKLIQDFVNSKTGEEGGGD
ncbi:unnamed protein product [Meloidogyne enterolobii]|uniref:Transcription and mRNA export factor ENY2 n=3 Tax=Meloidogyne TaxID=189290 RepID=A0A6V7U9T8_MELEN|nr:unnamed protein product [Meloidogyne enterolobii]CAD2150914.1 unnamed protein product [Meloidogyne enterolobii]CAD2199488.1 unnamed protein product [Meloidogyne enterolobii]